MGLAPLITLIFFLIVSNNLPSSVMSVSNGGCSTSYCEDSGHDPDIRFPFKVKGTDQPSSCGFPGYDVWCDQGPDDRTLIELPSSGNFSVKSIDYTAQEIWVNDVNNCLPKKLISLNLTNSPFTMIYYQEFTFYNCTSSIVTQNNTINFNVPIIGPIPCLSGLDYYVYAIPLIKNNNITITILSMSKCYMVAQKVKGPVQWLPSLNNETGLSSISKLNEDVRLSWFMTECQSCELQGRMCAMTTNSSGFDVIGCSNVTNQGRPRKVSLTTMIAVILVICSPSIICVVGSLYIWIRAYLTQSPSGRNPSQPRGTPELGLNEVNVVHLGPRNESSPSFVHTIAVSEMEEMGPSMSLDEENVCSICMVEYKVKDKMGTLPLCGHYFHANCINEWLHTRGMIERTCPICRARVG